MNLGLRYRPVGRHERGGLPVPGVAALAFGASTFLVSSFRASLNPERDFQLLDPKRMVLIATGALVFWLVIRVREHDRLDASTIRRMALTAGLGIAMLLSLALAWDAFVTRDTANTVARNVRWILLWSGYFGTGFAAWMAWQFRGALREAQTVLNGLAPVTGDGLATERGFWVKTGRQTVFIAHDDIEWIEAEGNYARIHGPNAVQGLVRQPLVAIEAQLESDGFVRVHRSAICRQSAICGYRRKPSGAMVATLDSGVQVPVGRAFARVLTGHARSATGQQLVADDTVSCS